jgi:uncharacterized protein YggU (UPF0235/DUF167 family)
MLEVKASDGGAAFWVKVVPRASFTRIEGPSPNALKVHLCAPPVKGAANQALLRLLAKALKVPQTRLRVVTGLKSRLKRIWVSGLAPAEVARRLGL